LVGKRYGGEHEGQSVCCTWVLTHLVSTSGVSVKDQHVWDYEL
jgi:hypothetical protein